MRNAFFVALLALPVLANKSPSADIKPLMVMHGRNSHITKQKLLRITTEAAWRRVWFEHKIGNPLPKTIPDDFEFAELDFEKVMAIVAFEGEGVNCRGYSVHSIIEDKNHISVRVKADVFQSGPRPPATQAWGIIVMPRSTKQVVLEHDVRNLIEAPSEWKEWRIFPAID